MFMHELDQKKKFQELVSMAKHNKIIFSFLSITTNVSFEKLRAQWNLDACHD